MHARGLRWDGPDCIGGSARSESIYELKSIMSNGRPIPVVGLTGFSSNGQTCSDIHPVAKHMLPSQDRLRGKASPESVPSVP